MSDWHGRDCPFCAAGPSPEGASAMICGTADEGYFVSCWNCVARGPVSGGAKAAVDAWNGVNAGTELLRVVRHNPGLCSLTGTEDPAEYKRALTLALEQLLTDEFPKTIWEVAVPLISILTFGEGPKEGGGR
jgi:hypothetical protein